MSLTQSSWFGRVKDFLKKRNKTFKLADLKRLVPEAFDHVTPEIWRNCCRKAEEENRFWETDGLQEEAVDRFIIEFGVSDTESGESDNSESDDDDDDMETELDKDDLDGIRADASLSDVAN